LEFTITAPNVKLAEVTVEFVDDGVTSVITGATHGVYATVTVSASVPHAFNELKTNVFIPGSKFTVLWNVPVALLKL
jgi:hypothetical protein